MAVIDIVVIAVLVLFGVIGMIKGFLGTLISLFGNLASVGVAVLCAKPVAKFLDSVFHIVERIGGRIAAGLTNITPFTSNIEAVSDGVLDGAELKAYMPKNTLYERALGLFVEDGKNFNLADYADAAQADQAVVNYIGEKVAAILAIVIAAIVIFILLRVAILILAKIFNALSRNKAISGMDKAVGLLIGLIKGALIISLALGIFYLIANETVNGWIENSVVTKWIYNYICQLIEWAVSKFSLPEVLTNLFPQIANP